MIGFRKERALASGTTSRYVRCEHCSAEYGYDVHRDIEVSFIVAPFQNPERALEPARARAQARLKHALAVDVDPHPCPKCRRLQADMVREARRRHLAWMSGRPVVIAALTCLALGALSLLPLSNLGDVSAEQKLALLCAWAALLAIIASLPLLRTVLAARFQPNEFSREQMNQRGWRAGILLEDWEKWLDNMEEYFSFQGRSQLFVERPRPSPPA